MARTNDPAGASVGLPYINSAWFVLLTVGINLLISFICNVGSALNFVRFLIDSALCGLLSPICLVLYIRWAIQKRRRLGMLPNAVPESRLLMRLPKNPTALIIVLSLFFAVFMALIALGVAWFFGITTFTFMRFMVWKAIYSLILNIKIAELVVLRYVQKDCQSLDDPVQTGAETVKNPLPGKDKFLRMFDTMVNDFGFNLVIGLLTGGAAVLADKSVIIYPTTRSGIVLGGLILGVIVSLRMVASVVKSIAATRDAGTLPALEKRNPWVAWIPETPMLFTLTLMPVIMALSAVVLWAVLTFFGFDVLNFFQFFIVRTIYVSLLTKPVVWLAVYRYRQPGRSKASSHATIQ